MSEGGRAALVSLASRFIIPMTLGGIGYCFNKRFWRSLLKRNRCNEFCHQEQSIISKLPRKVRIKIWSSLDQNKIMKLRLVCRLMKQDVEYEIGVTAIVGDKSEYSFSDKNIGVRHCTVTSLENSQWTSSWHFLHIPEILERLTIESTVVIEPDIVDVILSQFNNLRVLKFVCENWIASGTVEDLEKTRKTLKYLSRKEILTHLTVQQKVRLRGRYYVCYLHWETQFTKNNANTNFFPDSFPEMPNHLIYLELLIPTLHNSQKQLWLDLVREQTTLRTLSINLGYVYWGDYSRIIRNNEKTLDTVYLLSIGGWNEKYSKEDPFNFAVFENCFNVRELILTAAVGRLVNLNPNASSYYYLPIVNLDRLPSLKLESITLLWMFLTQEDIQYIQICGTMEKPWKGFLLGCQGGFVNENGIVIKATLGGSFFNNANVPEAASKYQLRSSIYSDSEQDAKWIEDYCSVTLDRVCEVFKRTDLLASLLLMM